MLENNRKGRTGKKCSRGGSEWGAKWEDLKEAMEDRHKYSAI